jgi:cold shock CspA family protein
MDASYALEARIYQKISKLNGHCRDLMGCHVVVKASHHHQTQGRLYSVRIDLTLPDANLTVSHHPGKKPKKHEKVYAVMNNAFLAMEKKLTAFKEARRGHVKTHISNIQTGQISKLNQEEGYGFISTPDEQEIYFHKNAVSKDQFLNLEIGSKVRFVLAPEAGIDGPQASLVSKSR